MTPVDRELLEQLEETRAMVRAARDEVLRRSQAVAHEREQLAKRLAVAQQALADARSLLSGVESESVARAQRERRVIDDVLKLLLGLFAMAALAALVGLLRHGPVLAPWALLFPLAGAAAFFVARQLARRLQAVDAVTVRSGPSDVGRGGGDAAAR